MSNFWGPLARYSCKNRGTSSPCAKLMGDFGSATETMRIIDLFALLVFAKNWGDCKFRLLQHYPLNSRHQRQSSHVRFVPCVDGSELARAFFTFAALVGAAMCSAF